MTREEAIEQLNFMIETIPKEPSAECDSIKEWLDTDKDIRNALEMAIKLLEQEPCEDCISRKAVLNTLDFTDKFLDETRTVESYKTLLEECYKNLPSVTPTHKKGKWIGTCQIGFGEFAECEIELIDGFVTDNCHCSECGEELEKGERGIYCPNCGSFMRGEED